MADITLPARSLGSSGARRGIRLPTADDVQRVAGARDPGLAFSRNSLSEAAAVGQGLAEIADVVHEKAERQRLLEEATAVTEGKLSYERESMEELRRRQLEDDPSRQDFMADYEKHLIERESAILKESKLSGEGKERLSLRLKESRGAMVDGAGRLQLAAAQKRAEDAADAQINQWSAQAQRDPQFLDTFLEMAREGVALFNGALSPEAERALDRKARQSIILSGINGLIDQKKFDDADARLNSGQFDEDLDLKSRGLAQNAIDRARKTAAEDAERREAKAEREHKKAQTANEAALLAAVDAEQDIPESTLRDALATQKITPEAYRMLVDRRRGVDTGRDNPHVVTTLQERMIRGGDDIHKDIITARNSGALSATTTGQLMAENQRRQAETRTQDWRTDNERNAFQYVSRFLGQDKLAFSFDDDTAQRLALAQREFIQRVKSQDEDPWAVADEITQKFGRVAAAPPKLGYGIAEPKDFDGIISAGQRLRSLRDSGKITPMDYDREMRVLRQWQESLPQPTQTPAPAKPRGK